MGMAYSGSPLGSPAASPSGPGSPLRLGERNLRFPSNLRNLGGWTSDPSGYMNENFPSSLLDEFKSNKARSFELAEITGHVVEFRYAFSYSTFLESDILHIYLISDKCLTDILMSIVLYLLPPQVYMFSFF
jgi:pumilio RNA-binding family